MLFSNENKFDNEINQVSRELSIPPYIIKGLVALESNFNPKSYKYEPHLKDASYGLTQILSKTAISLGYKPPALGIIGKNLYDPYTNLYYGIKYLKSLYDKYKNWDDTIASYNMGYPRPASKTTSIIKNIYGTPKPDWKYANQPYVDRVKAYISYYKALYEGNLSLAEKIKQKIREGKIKEIIESPFIPIILVFSLIWLLLKK